MKICVVGDIHLSQYSSILRTRGIKYSKRLENIIKSINWVESVAKQKSCDISVYLGDFFDKAELNAEEITAINDIQWHTNMKYLLVGNHEMGINDLSYSSAHLFNIVNLVRVIDHPITIPCDISGTSELVFIPYILEKNRKELKEYVLRKENTQTIVFSHNDLKGIRYGAIESKEGFEIKDIEDNCDLFINGHLHNGIKVTDKIINLGNLTGQNFGEDAFQYKHNIMILDTDTLKYELIENPYAYNFYKVDTVGKTKEEVKAILDKMGSNRVVAFSTTSDNVDEIKELAQHSTADYRLVVSRTVTPTEQSIETLTSDIDHLQRFIDYIKCVYGEDAIINSELKEVTNK